MSATFTLGGDTYSVKTMDPRVQFFVLKRLARFLPALSGSQKIIAAMSAGTSVQVEDALEVVAVLAPIVATTPDADLDFVTDACFDVVRQQGRDGDPRWYPVRDKDSGVISNRDNAEVLRKLAIVGNVLRTTFAPMLAEVSPNVAGLSSGASADPEAALL